MSRGRCKGEAVAHEDVVNYLEPTQPNPGYKEGFVVRLARPKRKKMSIIDKQHIENGEITEISQSKI